MLKGYACGSFTLKSNPLTLLNLYTINSRYRSFYKPNRQNSLPFHILQLEKVSPLSDTTLLYKTALFRSGHHRLVSLVGSLLGSILTHIQIPRRMLFVSLVYLKPALAQDTKNFLISVSESGKVTVFPGYLWLCRVKKSPWESTIDFT